MTGPSGPLAGLKVIEFAGIGPAPMCAMLLADAGAEVLRIDRQAASGLGIARPVKFDLLTRNRRSVAIDIKHPDGVACALDLVGNAHAVIEGFRPGTMERLGLGPEVCMERNPALVYGRVTGWGQTGPLCAAAGHDLNYIALSGVLHAVGRAGQPPTPPLNLVGDFAGGAMLLAFGICAALLHARTSGHGQVIDAAMVEGSAALLTSFYGLLGAGLHTDQRGVNLLDSGAPYYDVYRCADGLYVSVAAIEEKFQQILVRMLGFDDFPDVRDRQNWPAARQLLVAKFAERTRAEWAEHFDGSDACVAPVLSLREAPGHHHNAARATFVEIDGVVQPAPVPRFSATPSRMPTPPESPGASTTEALAAWGIDAQRITALGQRGLIGLSKRR